MGTRAIKFFSLAVIGLLGGMPGSFEVMECQYLWPCRQTSGDLTEKAPNT